jgi:hypothetical protein
VNLRDAFGNRCDAVPAPAIRCKLVCSSSDGCLTLVEASDATIVLPSLGETMPPPNGPTLSPSNSAPEEANVCDQLDKMRSSDAQGSDTPCSTADNSSLEGEVDIGRCNTPLSPLVFIPQISFAACSPARRSFSRICSWGFDCQCHRPQAATNRTAEISMTPGKRHQVQRAASAFSALPSLRN